MASGVSNFLAGKIIDHLLRNQAYTPPSTIYVALFTTMPTRSSAGTEVSGSAYARQSVALSAASSGLTDNTALITFPTASGGNWGTILGIGIMDASTAGNLLWFGTLTASRVVNDGTTFTIAASDIDIDFGVTT
jgi:hypothetical protein